MKVYFLKQQCLEMLEQSVPENLDRYQDTETWVDKFFSERERTSYYFDSKIEVDDYKLILGGPETDFENAKILYEAFRGKINLVQASDLRLWAFLAHTTHWDYMHRRWAIDATDDEEAETEKNKRTAVEKAISRVGTRYFFKASKGKAFVRQGIARLYWSAYLTYDESNPSGNPYEYTEYFFSKQDIFTSITERSYARNKVLLIAALRKLRQHPELSRGEIRAFLARLNQAGAIIVLDFLNKEQAENLCENVMEEIIRTSKLIEGSKFSAVSNITGKKLGSDAVIKDGKAVMAGRTLLTTPKNLIGKKEGDKFIVSGKEYIIRNIK